MKIVFTMITLVMDMVLVVVTDMEVYPEMVMETDMIQELDLVMVILKILEMVQGMEIFGLVMFPEMKRVVDTEIKMVTEVGNESQETV